MSRLWTFLLGSSVLLLNSSAGLTGVLYMRPTKLLLILVCRFIALLNTQSGFACYLIQITAFEGFSSLHPGSESSLLKGQ